MNHQRKRIVVIGASGTIGAAVAQALQEQGHEVLAASRKGPVQVDLEDSASIGRMLTEVGQIDAIICTAGRASFASVLKADDASFELSLRSKLMGQVNLIRQAAAHLDPAGSIIITTGMLGTTPGPGTAPVAMVNAGLEGLVRAAAKDLPQGPRVLAVAPPFVRETAIRMGMGEIGLPAKTVAACYVEALNTDSSGVTLRPEG